MIGGGCELLEGYEGGEVGVVFFEKRKKRSAVGWTEAVGMV